MPTIQTSSKKQKQKHRNWKNQPRHPTDIGTPNVSLRNNWHQQQHELLSDWEVATVFFSQTQTSLWSQAN